MLELKNFKPRLYQENILKTAIDSNTLVVIPTGLGKTAISVMLTIDRLNKHQNSKTLLCSPTKPLCQQHIETLKKLTTIKENDISLITGLIKPEKRLELYKSRIIVATPQTIQSDLENNRILLKDFSLLTIDEAHRSRMRYANTLVSRKYLEQSNYPRILALTASPGGTKERIEEICENLAIEKVEIRTETDEDVKPYVQEKNQSFINIDLPQEFKKVQDILKQIRKEKLKSLQKLGFTKPTSLVNKRDLLSLQSQFRSEISLGNKTAFFGISLIAQLLKIEHCLELIETQGVNPLKNFIDKLSTEETKAAKSILNNKKFSKLITLVDNLIKEKRKHPKIAILKKMILEQLEENKNSKIIVFANFRYTIDNLLNNLRDDPTIKPVKLVGQKLGLTQKEQISTLKKFESGIFNTLITTSIGEEGLDVAGADLAIFYEAVPSEIRKVQRMGRVGRTQKGKIIFLLTKDSRDQAYYWSAKRKEETMKSILYKMKNKVEKKSEKQSMLI